MSALPSDNNKPHEGLMHAQPCPTSPGQAEQDQYSEDCPHNGAADAAPSLSPEFRAEAIFRLLQGIGIASRDNGTPLLACWVPVETIDSINGEIIAEKNVYQSIRVLGRSYPAHSVMLMLVHNRKPIWDVGPDVDEVAMHLCNNPACRNPIHLKFGTRQQDSDHKVQCGRAPSGKTNGHATKPWATPRGNQMSHCKLREPMRAEVISLIKKYHGTRKFATRIAIHADTTEDIIYNLVKEGAHLKPGVKDTDIELPMVPWGYHAPSKPKPDMIPIVDEIRKRFHDAPIVERSGLLLQFEKEYNRSDVWIRQVLNRKSYPDATPDIPVPDNFGIGRRIHKTLEKLGRESDNEEVEPVKETILSVQPPKEDF